MWEREGNIEPNGSPYYGTPEWGSITSDWVSSFSPFTFGGASPDALPVEMIYFEAEAVDNKYIQLKWSTAIEIYNKEFQVERSTDAQNWATIGSVAGHGNTTSEIQYTFDDKAAIANTRYYYRLKQVDFNGAFKYTGIATAIITNNEPFSLKDFIPNPTMGSTSMVAFAPADQEITLEMFDLVGRKVMSNKHRLTTGMNQIDLEVLPLAAGTYAVVITSDNGVYAKKLVIAR